MLDVNLDDLVAGRRAELEAHLSWIIGDDRWQLRRALTRLMRGAS